MITNQGKMLLMGLFTEGANVESSPATTSIYYPTLYSDTDSGYTTACKVERMSYNTLSAGDNKNNIQQMFKTNSTSDLWLASSYEYSVNYNDYAGQYGTHYISNPKDGDSLNVFSPLYFRLGTSNIEPSIYDTALKEPLNYNYLPLQNVLINQYYDEKENKVKTLYTVKFVSQFLTPTVVREIGMFKNVNCAHVGMSFQYASSFNGWILIAREVLKEPIALCYKDEITLTMELAI